MPETEYKKGIIDYYSKTGMDYEPWSPQFNMHFGYYRWGLNPFDREQMLNEMNQQILQRLELDLSRQNYVLDLGCGVGTSARYALDHFPNTKVCAVTLVPWQIEKGIQLSQRFEHKDRLTFHLCDFCDHGLPDKAFHGAYAIESSCYDAGKDKAAFLTEAYRALAPGSRLVISDGFTKRARHGRVFNFLYRKVCAGWALSDFADIEAFTGTMKRLGFEDIQIQEASWRVAVSVASVPWVSLVYFLKSILLRKGDRQLQKGHFIAPIYGLLMGLHRRDYGYYIISARKPAASDEHPAN